MDFSQPSAVNSRKSTFDLFFDPRISDETRDKTLKMPLFCSSLSSLILVNDVALAIEVADL